MVSPVTHSSFASDVPPVQADRMSPSSLTDDICRLMSEFVANQQYMYACSSAFHQGEGVGELDDRCTISSDPWFKDQDKYERIIVKHIQLLQQAGGRRPLDYFSAEEIRDAVDPFFDANPLLNMYRKDLGMARPARPVVEKRLSEIGASIQSKQKENKSQEPQQQELSGGDKF